MVDMICCDWYIIKLMLLVVELNEIDVAHVTTSIYVNSWEKYVSIVLLWYTNQNFDPDFDHLIDMLATTTTIKQVKPLELIS